MIIGKEALVALESYAKKQTRIFNDSADLGIEVKDNPALRIHIRELCKTLAETYKSTKYVTKSCKHWSCFVPYEQEGFAYNGVKVEVTFNQTKRKEFFTIYISSATSNENPFKDES